MGLFKLLATPFTAPVRGLGAVVTTIHDMAMEQFASPDAIRKELVRLEDLLHAGDITEDEYDDLEDALLDRLEQIEAMQQQQEE